MRGWWRYQRCHGNVMVQTASTRMSLPSLNTMFPRNYAIGELEAQKRMEIVKTLRDISNKMDSSKVHYQRCHASQLQEMSWQRACSLELYKIYLQIHTPLRRWTRNKHICGRRSQQACHGGRLEIKLCCARRKPFEFIFLVPLLLPSMMPRKMGEN